MREAVVVESTLLKELDLLILVREEGKLEIALSLVVVNLELPSCRLKEEN